MASEASPLNWRSWQAPPAMSDQSRRLGWIDDVTSEGQSWLKSQRGYEDIKRGLDTISGKDSGPAVAEYRSHLNPNRLKRNMREVVGALAKLRPMWGYHSDNKGYAAQAEMFNKVTKAWYLESFADRSIREALQYASVTCRGWVRPVYRRDMYGTGRGDIKLLTYGAPCVLPFQLPASGDWQSAYAVTILDEMPVAMAHGMFPAYQSQLVPSSSRFWYQNDAVRKSASGNLLRRMFGGGPRRSGGEGLTDLLVPIRYTHVLDLTVNTTKMPIPMGEPGSSWAYTVPFVGQDIMVGRDSHSGSSIYRKADENDARLYPYRRVMISSDKCIMYDGPGFDWHGMFPGVSFCLDDYPWEPLGLSMVNDGFDLNEAIKKIVRGNMDKVSAQLSPSYAYDTNAIARAEANKFDPFQPNARLGFDGAQTEGTPFHPAMDAESLKVQPESAAMVEYLENAMDSQMAVKDAMTLAKMRAVGSMDDLEKIMESNGPIIEDISRSMEPPMRDLGVMVKYLIMQYYTTPRVMQIVGIDGVSPEVFDYDPSSLVPSHLPGEDTKSASTADKIKRARTFADNLRFFILPNSLHEMSQMTMKLGLIQLRKAGIKIDSQTIAEAWNIPSYGTIDGNTVLERWKNEQEQDLEFAARMAELKNSLPGAQPNAPPGAPAPGKNPEGRPATMSAPPSIQQKDGGTRSTIATSK